jgi:hypothetical protein
MLARCWPKLETRSTGLRPTLGPWTFGEPESFTASIDFFREEVFAPEIIRLRICNGNGECSSSSPFSFFLLFERYVADLGPFAVH